MASRPRFTDIEALTVVTLDEMRSLGETYRIANIDYYSSSGKILQLLQEERKRSQLYDNAWRKAERIYEARKGTLAGKGMKECSIALISYTLENNDGPSLYQDFNKKSRELREHTWDAFPYKSLWLLLSRALKNIVGGPAIKGPGFACYRGVSLDYDVDLRKWRGGTLVVFSSFTSASVKKDAALQFMGNPPRGTLIEFRNTPLAGKGIKAYSEFPGEEEVLIYPWSSYEVVEYVRKGTYNRLVLRAAGPLSAELPYNWTELPQP